MLGALLSRRRRSSTIRISARSPRPNTIAAQVESALGELASSSAYRLEVTSMNRCTAGSVLARAFAPAARSARRRSGQLASRTEDTLHSAPVPREATENVMGKQIEELAQLRRGDTVGRDSRAVREHAKLVLLDTLGVILAGSVQPEVAGVRARLTATGGRGATVYAPGWPTTDPRTAALLNGLAGRSIELCEGHRYVSCQGAVQVLPTALASAEWLERSGREALAALIFGYEVAARLGAGLTARPLAHQNGQAPLLGRGGRRGAVARIERRADEPGASDRRDPRPHARLHERRRGRDRAQRGRRNERLRRSAGAGAGAGRCRRAAERDRGSLRPAGRRRIPGPTP